MALFAGGALGLSTQGRDEGLLSIVVNGGVFLRPTVGGDLGAVTASLQERVRSDDDDWRSAALLGLAYLQQGVLTQNPSYYRKAERVFLESLARNRAQNFEATLGMGVLAVGRHEFRAALEWADRARRLNRFSAEAYGVLGDALIELGRYQSSARAYQRMVDLRPGLSSYARVSYWRELNGDVRGAIGAMTAAVDAAGTPEDAAWAGYQLGDLFLGTGRVDRAAAEYGRAAGLAPDAPLPEAGRAKVHAARGDMPGAIRILSDVVARYPSLELTILLGDLQRVAGRLDQARDTYQLVRAMKRLLRDAGVDTGLETALFDADHGRHLQAALRRARAAYRSRPSVVAADALAWTLYSNRRFGQAARYSKEALRLGTRNALFHFHAGMIAIARHDPVRAGRELQTSLSINPRFSYRWGGVARRTLSRIEEAE
jgi:tetratricopeptide (TPR) repeat protein